MSKKIRILFMSANPSDTGHIRVDAEAREIFEKLEEGSARSAFELIKYPALRPGDLARFLMKHKPHIVHFSGHGSREKKIVLEGAAGKSKLVDRKALTDLFRLLKDNVRVVVLNACYSKPQALALNEVIDFTVGISKTIGDRAAVTFAGAFYRALAFGRSFEEAFELGKVELGLMDISGGKVLEFLVKEGADPSVGIIPSSGKAGGKDGKILKTALAQLVGGTATEKETNLVRRAMLDGTLILEQNEEADAGTPVTFEGVGKTGGGKSFHAGVDIAAYRRIQEQLYPPPPGIGPPLPGLIFIGRDASVARVKELLQSKSDNEPDNNLAVVRGWPGVGKTTLVGVIGRDPEVLQIFPDGVLWTSLERRPEIMTKLAEWGRTLGTNEFLGIPAIDEAVAKLAALIRHKRMLLIVDDIWKQEHAVPFLKAAAGSRCALLATTRLPDVADALTRDETRIYNLPVLKEEDALLLLRYLAPKIVEQHPSECRVLVRDLGYLPLALHVAGRLLKAEAKMGLSVIDLIEGIREGAKLFPESAPLDRTEGTTLPTVHALLKRSTDDLEEPIRDCFAFLGAFAPKPATFDLAAMKSVWQTDDPESIVRKLTGHGLLEPIGAQRFQMHELLVSHARSLLN